MLENLLEGLDRILSLISMVHFHLFSSVSHGADDRRVKTVEGSVSTFHFRLEPARNRTDQTVGSRLRQEILRKAGHDVLVTFGTQRQGAGKPCKMLLFVATQW